MEERWKSDEQPNEPRRQNVRNKKYQVGHVDINSIEKEVPLRSGQVEGRAEGDVIVIDVDRSLDLSAAIRGQAHRLVSSIDTPFV